MSEAQAWAALTRALGIEGSAVGQPWRSAPDTPPLSGIVETMTEDPFDALIRLDSPTAGLAALGAYVYPGSPTTVAMNLYLYGDDAAATVARITQPWEEWFRRRFPAPA